MQACSDSRREASSERIKKLTSLVKFQETCSDKVSFAHLMQRRLHALKCLRQFIGKCNTASKHANIYCSPLLKAVTVIFFLLYIDEHFLQANDSTNSKEARTTWKYSGLTNYFTYTLCNTNLSEKSQLWYSFLRSKFCFTICKDLTLVIVPWETKFGQISQVD